MHSAAGAVLLALSFWISPISAYTYAVKCTTFGCFSKLHRSRTHAMDCVEARKAEHETTLAFSVDFLSGLQQLNYTSISKSRVCRQLCGPTVHRRDCSTLVFGVDLPGSGHRGKCASRCSAAENALIFVQPWIAPSQASLEHHL